MAKNHWHKLKFLHQISPWPFLILAIVFSALAAQQLRSNYAHMSELREAVYAADKNNGDVQTALKDLQAYVTRHMNTNLQSGATAVYPPIQLKYTYERLVKQQNAQNEQVNSQIYSEAQKHCEGQNNAFFGSNRIPCIQDYVRSHTPSTAKQIPDALYKFSFVSPKWSPDLAGWSIVLAIISGITFVITFFYHKVVTKHWL